MSIKVHIWYLQNITGNWGHASMSLSDGTHISWWPAEGNERKSVLGKAFKAPPVGCVTLDDDIRGEGRDVDITLTIPPGFIDEAAIKIWWQSFSKEKNWHAIDQNCSTVVFKALCAGFAMDLFPAAEKEKYESVGIWTPEKVDEFVTYLQKYISPPAKPTVLKPTVSKKGWGCFIL